MADKQKRPLVGLHRLLNPLPAVDVQVVGRLVQHQQVDLLVHQHAQPQAALLAAGEDGHGLEHVLPPEVEGPQPVPGGLGGHAPLGVEHGVHQVPLGVVKVDDLGQVGGADGGAVFDPALVGPLLVHQDFQQGGFSRTVVADEGDPLAALHPQVHPPEQLPLSKGFPHLPDLHHLVPEELLLSEAVGHGPGLGGLFRLTDALNAPLNGKGPFVEQLRTVLVHLGGRLRQPLNLRLLLLIPPQLLQIPPFLFNGVKAVVAGVEFRVAAADLNDPADGPVQKVPVMADGNHGSLDPADVVLQPLHRVEVQVVGRFVQQQHVRVLQNQTAQVHTGFLAAGETVKKLGAHILGDGQAVGHLAHRRLRVIAADALEFRRQLAVTPESFLAAVPGGHAGG